MKLYRRNRYRDFIVYNKNINKSADKCIDKNIGKSDVNKKCIFGAFVLFPYNNEEFRNNKFYKSIEEVNIGAIPFLPAISKEILISFYKISR